MVFVARRKAFGLLWEEILVVFAQRMVLSMAARLIVFADQELLLVVA